MRRTSLAELLTRIALACAAAAVLLVCGALAAEETEPPAKEAEVIPPPKAAESQDDAITLAKEEDLPAIAKANKVVIKQLGPDENEITIGARELLKQIREALTVKKTEPSGGENKYTLTFFLDDKPIREVWVYDYGEWGITRNQGPEWTLGRNEKLADLIDDLVEAADNPSDDDTDDEGLEADDDDDNDDGDDADDDDAGDDDDDGEDEDDD